MWHKPYGRTGKEISAIGFGGMRFDNPQDIDANAEIVLYAHSKGINYFDTAPYYCQDKSEIIVGTALRQLPRESFHVSTKCGAADGDALRESLDRSLERLGVDQIDFFHIWCVLSMGVWQARKDGGAVQAALKAKEEGLVGHVVVSSHLPGGDLRKVLSEGFFEGVTLGYCAINFPYRQEAVDAAGEMGLGVVTMNPLGGGIIPQNAERFDFLRGPGDESVVSAAIRFNVSQPAITSALVGFTTREHVDEAVAAVEDFQPYAPEKVDAIRGKVLETFDGLCTGCGYCLPCPSGVDIPRMMDSYNMKILHDGDAGQIPGRLKYHWGLKPEDAAACSLCGACEEKCTQGLPIRERLQEIAAIGEQEKAKEQQKAKEQRD